MIGKRLGRYEIVEKIGSGGWGDVYRARDERLDRDVALKVLSQRALEEDTSRRRFRKEALVLSRLNHPNIATILDFDTQDGLDFLVMEYIQGTTLQDLTKNKLTERDIVHYAMQIVAALEEAHQFGIIHRDLKPNNVLVTPKGQVKVLDFGLAKMLQPIGSQVVTHLTTESNLVVGTFPYMSPEQLRTEQLDARSDIYSFGVTLYEMATGQRPHQETQPISLVDAILHKEPLPPVQVRSDLSPGLQKIILKCLQKDPENRYQSAKDLMTDFRLLLTPSGYSAIQHLTREKTKLNWRKIGWFAAIPAVLLLITVALFLFQTRHSKTSPAANLNISSVVAVPARVFGAEENRFLADAIPNALSTHLSQVQGLQTKLPPTQFEMERVENDLMKLAKAYDVNALIASSVTADENRLILNVQLIEADTRRLLWSRDFDGTRGNYLDLVRTAADQLRSVLHPESSPLPVAEFAPGSHDAELVFQRGYYHMRSYANLKQQSDYDAAFRDLQHALRLDPTNARAAAALARLHVAKLESGAPLREVLPQIDKWAYHALKLDHECGEAWQVLSVAEEMRPNGVYAKRLDYSLKAATYANQSGYSHHVLSSALSRNSFSLSEVASNAAVRQEPLHLNGLLFRAGILSRQGRAAEALVLIDRVLSMQKRMPMAELMKEWLLLRNHQVRDAEKLAPLLDEHVVERRLHPGWVGFGRDWLEFERNKALKNKAGERAALNILISQARGEVPPWFRWELITGTVIGIQALNDSHEATLETLSIRAQKGIFEPYDWLMLSPELKPLRTDSEFKTIAAQSKKEFQEMLTALERARNQKELPGYLEKPLQEMKKLL